MSAPNPEHPEGLGTAEQQQPAAPIAETPSPSPLHSGLPRKGTLHHTMRSHESIAQDLSNHLTARRSAASYDYLADEHYQVGRGDADGTFSYHTAKQPSGKRGFDYLDEDQNRARPLPPGSVGSLTQRNPTNLFDSGSDDDDDPEEQLLYYLNHEIRKLKARQARHDARLIGNPGPVGLIGFGMCLILLGLCETLVFEISALVPSMGICFGGGTLMIMGVLEWVQRNTLAYVAFVGYGAFWFSIVCIYMLPNSSNGGSNVVAPPSEYFVGVFFVVWGFFSLNLTCCVIRLNVILFLVELTVTLSMFLIGGGSMSGDRTAVKAGGYVMIVAGCLSMYLGVSEVVNEVFDYPVLPIFPMTKVLEMFETKEKKEEKTEAEVAVP